MKPEQTPKHKRPPRDESRYAGVPGLPGVEVLSACFVDHRFGPHTHDTWALGAVIRGVQDNSARDSDPRIVRAGELTAIPPGEVHAGRLIGTAPCAYVMVYIPDSLLRQETQEIGLADLNLTMKALADDQLARKLSSFVGLALSGDTPDLSIQGEWVELIGALGARYGGMKAGARRTATAGAGLKRALELLETEWSHPVTLDQLAHEAKMSPTSFCREFSRVHGISPHRYQVVLRVNRAKELLVGGGGIAEVAAATGFADQSHLGRHLKSCLGVTPGAIALASQRTRTFYPGR